MSCSIILKTAGIGALVLLCHASMAQLTGSIVKKHLLFSDKFKKGLNQTHWWVETLPDTSNRVYTLSGKLWLDTRDGVTVWYSKPLQGNYCITYTRGFAADSGANNRLSDLNNFWQASDPRNVNLFTRKGVLASYDSLLLYYAGIGGNYNSTTRFRKYDGNGNRVLLQEFTDSPHLLHANKPYHITILVKGATTQLWVNKQVWFSYTDAQPLPAGYFGLRSTKSRQWVDDVEIWEVD
jgi:rhamnogalacturonan endolyase